MKKEVTTSLLEKASPVFSKYSNGVLAYAVRSILYRAGLTKSNGRNDEKIVTNKIELSFAIVQPLQ